MQPIKKYLERTGFGVFRPKAVLFDMDGVLINSMPNHAVAWQRSMATFGIRMTADDAYATEGARGIDTIRNMVKQQQGKDITLEEAQAMYDVKTRFFGEMPKAEIMPGAYELMEKLHQEGFVMAVVTGSGQRPLINRLTTDFHPFITEETEPWETIVVENAPLGIQAGVAAQCFTIGVNTGPLPDEQLWQAGADLVIPSMTALCEMWNEECGMRIVLR